MKHVKSSSSDIEDTSTNSTSINWKEVTKLTTLNENSTRRGSQRIFQSFRKRLARLESDHFLPYLEPYFILSFLQVNHFNEEKACECYQRFFRIRTIDPDYYFPINRGSLSYKSILDNNVAFILSTKNPFDGIYIYIYI